MTTNPTTERPLAFSPSLRGPRPLTHPVPAAVAAAVPEQEKHHRDVVVRYEEAAGQRRQLQDDLAKAVKADDEARVQRELAGGPPPKLAAPDLEQELAEATRREEAATEALRRSATDLLRAAEPKLPEVARQLNETIAGDLAAARAETEALLERLAAIGELADARQWTWLVLGGRRGDVPPYFTNSRPRPYPPDAGQHVRQALEELDDLTAKHEKNTSKAQEPEEEAGH